MRNRELGVVAHASNLHTRRLRQGLIVLGQLICQSISLHTRAHIHRYGRFVNYVLQFGFASKKVKASILYEADILLG